VIERPAAVDAREGIGETAARDLREEIRMAMDGTARMPRSLRSFRRGARALALATGIGAVAAAAFAPAAQADTLCVGPHPPCFATITKALHAAADGDVIRVRAGTFAGGFRINKSVRLVGAGADETTIRGGGPAVVIGRRGATSEPTVSIGGVTIRGGDTAGNGFVAVGGGIYVPFSAGFQPGATLTVHNSVVTGNRAAPTTTVPSGIPCPGGDCPFALALGGGIGSFGSVTLRNTEVTGNRAAGVASDADGAGVGVFIGSVRLINSEVTGNRALATRPNGRFAEGGGVYANSGVSSVTVRSSDIAGNSTTLRSDLPYSFDDGTTIDMNSNSGGIHVGDGIATEVVDSAITGNRVEAVDTNGEPSSFDGGMFVGNGSELTMRRTTVAGNQVTARLASNADVGPAGTALELDGGGTITNSHIDGNGVTVTSPRGLAAVTGGLAVFTFEGTPSPVLVRGTSIKGNTVHASSANGAAAVQGVGVLNNSLLTLRDDEVSRNTGVAAAPDGFAQGGGIWNGILLSGPPVHLKLNRTPVTRNSLSASGLEIDGAGLYTTRRVALTDSPIRNNIPDQCFGCTSPAAAQPAPAGARSARAATASSLTPSELAP
jgi:hypothetical protein